MRTGTYDGNIPYSDFINILTASQAVHVVAPVIDEVKLPAVQERHSSVSACGAYLPRVQFSHDLDALTYCPAIQEEHFVRPALLSSPVGHTTQAVCSLALVASSSLYVPAGQSEQALAPAAALYRPSSQTSHTFGDVAATVDEALPARHKLQFKLSPAVARYLPASHRVQFAAPSSAAYRPASQGVHPKTSSLLTLMLMLPCFPRGQPMHPSPWTR